MKRLVTSTFFHIIYFCKQLLNGKVENTHLLSMPGNGFSADLLPRTLYSSRNSIKVTYWIGYMGLISRVGS